MPTASSIAASAPARPIALDLTPLDAVRAWPRREPLAALVSVGRHPRWSRYSILARPAESIVIGSDDAPGLRRALRECAAGQEIRPSDAGPFVGGWIVSLRYEAGGLLEPSAAGARSSVSATLHRCARAIVHDNQRNRWWAVGDDPLIPDAAAIPETAPACVERLTGMEPTVYEQRVERALEYIRAGDVYQVNVAHDLELAVDLDPREFFAHVADRMAPWFGAYIDEERAGSATLSWSPELLAALEARRRAVVTRPIKGTRAGWGGADALLASEKDRAELAMIVDLMRNDLGRVCEFGSVRVDGARRAERHAGRGEGALLHTVATVRGRLRGGEDATSLLSAIFPAGSITGAPKIRAMQVIDELEARARGAYCGSIGCISACGSACFNVAIRTASLTGLPVREAEPFGRVRGRLRFPVGAGIVADSVSAQEWDETLQKGAAFLRAAEDFRPSSGAR